MLNSLRWSAAVMACQLCCTVHGQDVAAGSQGIANNSELVPSAVYDSMRTAYYHPGKIGLSCDASFAGVVARINGVVSPARTKEMSELKLRITTGDRTPTNVAITWPPSFPDADRARSEGVANGVIRGFFQGYWPLANAEFLPAPSDHATLARVSDSYHIEMQTSAIAVHITAIAPSMLVSQVQTHTTPDQDSTLGLVFKASPSPHEGDRARLVGISIDQTTGSAAPLHQATTWDEQDVGGVHIPRRITYSVPGSFEVPITLSNCAVSQTLGVVAPVK